MAINDLLNAHYSKHQGGINRIFEGPNKALDGPHLLYCWEEAYRKSNYKLLVLGQENNGWTGLQNNIDAQVRWYEEFQHGEEYNSPYWRAVHFFNESLNGKKADSLGFVASNVRKYCTDKGGRITDEDDALIVKNLNLLPGELETLKPDVVLFLSGPRYDNSIKLQLGEDLQFESMINGIADREMARLKHPDYPFQMYRTYHPGYLSRSYKMNYLQLISATIKGIDIDVAMQTFYRQMRELAAELDMQLEESQGTPGNAAEGFYFYRPDWGFSAIGFEFGTNGAGSFFYGMCRKVSATPIPKRIQESFWLYLPLKEDSNEVWPWWRWWEQKDWGEETFREVLDGTMKKKIGMIIADILGRLEGKPL